MATSSDPNATFASADERRHPECAVEEWWFGCWAADGSFGLLSSWRIVGNVGWYWAALARRDRPLVHMAEWSVPLRANPMIAKAHEMWAEIECVAPFEQWTIGNELYAISLDDPDDALGRAHGHVMPFAMDLEWYATSRAESLPADTGYRQRGVVHGDIELLDTGGLEIVEAPAERWHRWGTRLEAAPLPSAGAHLGLRAPVRLPDGTVDDLVLTAEGWAHRGAVSSATSPRAVPTGG